MSFKPQPARPIPEELAHLGAKLLAADNAYRLIGDRLYAQYDEAEFAELYAAEGKPAISPVILSFVTAFQFMENLGDRDAADALRLRLDWKYALHLPLDYAGFNFSVLSEFRERLIAHEAEARVLDRLLGQLRALGLIQRRGRQRSDSLAVLTKVRELNRLELVVETLRLALRAVLKQAPDWTRAGVPPTWEARYGERCIAAQLSQDERATLLAEVGQDGQWLLDRLHAPSTPAELRKLAEVQVLTSVWEQQFEVVDAQVVFKVAGPYEGKTRIQTPHDPEARYSKKGEQSWIGDKVQVTETDDEAMPHLITDIAITSSVETDYTALDDIQTRLEARDLTPGQQVVDGGYMSAPNLVASARRGIDLLGPLPPSSSPQARQPDGLSADQFCLDEVAQVAICPAGQRSRRGILRDKATVFRFAPKVCAACPLRPRCCSGQGGRSLHISHHHAVLQAARARQKTAEFKASYRQHRGGGEGCLSALVRAHGLRVGRYIGHAKRHLQALFTAVAVNLRRAARWLAGLRPQAKRRTGLGWAAAA
jgi:transposase